MSAFILNEYHLSVLGRAASAVQRPWGQSKRTAFDRTEARELAQVLYEENVKSVNYRYRETTPADDFEFDLQAFNGVLDPLVILKACACYDYQACEHPDYDQSAARLLIDRVRKVFIAELPGYEAANGWHLSPNHSQ